MREHLRQLTVRASAIHKWHSVAWSESSQGNNHLSIHSTNTLHFQPQIHRESDEDRTSIARRAGHVIPGHVIPGRVRSSFRMMLFIFFPPEDSPSSGIICYECQLVVPHPHRPSPAGTQEPGGQRSLSVFLRDAFPNAYSCAQHVTS